MDWDLQRKLNLRPDHVGTVLITPAAQKLPPVGGTTLLNLERTVAQEVLNLQGTLVQEGTASPVLNLFQGTLSRKVFIYKLYILLFLNTIIRILITQLTGYRLIL